MKAFVRFFFVLILIAQISGFAQIPAEKSAAQTSIITKSLLSPTEAKYTTSILPTTGGTSGNARAPQGAVRYTRTCYVITAAELASSGVPSNIKFTSLGFDFGSAQNIETTGDMKIYLQNTTDVSYAKVSLNWSNAPTSADGVIDNMTLVHDGKATIPAVKGYWGIPLSKGTDFTYTGGGLYVAFEYQNATGTLATTSNVALCNTTITAGLRNVFGSTSLGTVLGATSAFRPETIASWAKNVTNDCAVSLIYSYGKLPLVYGSPATIQAIVKNMGDNDLTNVSVTLKITGANSFTSTKVVPVVPFSSPGVVVTFDQFAFTAAGANNVTVSIPNDANNTNNTASTLIQTTPGSFAYADTSASTSSFSVGSGPILTKYFANGSTKVNSVTVTIGSSTANTGNTVYGVLIDTTGKTVAQSANYVITSSDLNKPVTFTFPTPVSISNQSFLVGIYQTTAAATYYPLATQDENPGRSNAYFYVSSTSVLTELPFYGRFMIQADVTPAPVVPVELASFTSSVKDGIVTLSWATATETNNLGFQVERKSSKDNVWSVAGFVKGNSTTAEISRYSYTDNLSNLGVAVYNYRLKQVDFDGTAKYYDLSQAVEVSAPKSFSLNQNYPNPFNPSTSITFSVPVDSKVKLDVYDVLGKVVKTLVNEQKAAGSYTVTMDASALSSGVYFYRLSADGNTLIKKMNLMK